MLVDDCNGKPYFLLSTWPDHQLQYSTSYTPYLQDHIALEDYEIHDGMNLELYYQ